ncbi:MAG: hypoxanthine phosphoribosyltransferase [Myxococcaceae bacterium]|jgi:hypoxanthine phosphoribosyltransferase|nr:hypoxanthine phosphoribosyltransferase [Myxococcaceae bacterium]
MPFYDRDVDVMIDPAKLQARIAELGAQITRDYQGKDLTIVGIMKGSIFFMTDLAKAIDLPITLELMGVSSYHGGTETTGEVRISFDLTKPMHGKHILVVEDIIDTGLTMQFLLENLGARHPASVKVCTLLEKPARAKTKVPIDYKGFVIEDKFVVGYGLDYGEKYRNLPFIGVMRTE